MMDSHMMDRLLDRYPPPGDFDKDEAFESQEPRRSPKRLPVERTIDLHGHTAESAVAALDGFIRDALTAGVKKVLIIHGKGSVPGSEGVLKTVVREYLEGSPSVGATGVPGIELGGSGATWALIRQRSR